MSYTFNCIQREETDYLYNETYNLIIMIQNDYFQSLNLSKYANIRNIKDISKIIEIDNIVDLWLLPWNKKISRFLAGRIPQKSEKFLFYIYLSLIVNISKINNFLERENFVDKIIYVINNMLNN